MSAPGKTMVTVNCRKEGLVPPVLIAGTFSDPPWRLQEMQCVTDQSGESHFTVQIPVDSGRQYQYKFKAGRQGPWFLDQHATTIDDVSLGSCNLLKVPMASNASDKAVTPLVEAMERGERPVVATGSSATVPSGPTSLLLHVSQPEPSGPGLRSSTPAEQVARVAAEVADTASRLDNPASESSSFIPPRDVRMSDCSAEKQFCVPLFAHEDVGAHALVDDDLESDESGRHPKSPTFLLSESGGSIDDLGFDDPTLEDFPSDRSSVLDVLRRIQCGVTNGPTILDDRRAKTSDTDVIDSTDDSDFALSSASPRRRHSRSSRGSLGRPRSAVSLTCIDEEPRSGESTTVNDAQQRKILATENSYDGMNEYDRSSCDIHRGG